MEFELQFDPQDIPDLAGRYQYEDDLGVLTIGATAKERGWYTRDEFIQVDEWKTPRIRSRAASNTARDIEVATREALASNHVLGVMEPLRRLHGVDWAVGSVLLHLAHPDPFPILDFRALEAFGIERPRWTGSVLWRGYVEATRSLAISAGVDMRTLDRALWQWSKEQVGQRSRTRHTPRADSPDIRRTPAMDVDVVILGCVSSKRREPAPAKDLYISPLWEKRRAYAVASGKPWVIYSAEHAILDPEQVIEWYDVALARLSAAQRRAKGEQAVTQLREKFGALPGKVFEIHAGAAYVDSLAAPLRRERAELVAPLSGLSIGYQLRWYGLPEVDR